MATRSIVAVKQGDDEFISIYVHNDGYPSARGPILLEHYNSEELARKLVAGGDASAIHRDGKVKYYAQRASWDRFGGRDEAWNDVCPQTLSETEVITFHEYAYAWIDGLWKIWSEDLEGWVLLTPHVWAADL